ncbi:MAG: low temperature requirement protein A [Micromonosporaceae bacterium]
MISPRPAEGGSPWPDEEARRVSSLELFFDLVFVFTLTQLSTLLTEELSLVGLIRVLLIFGVAWWMYGGYAWLTNAAAPEGTRERLLLLIGMAGFMVVALAIPGAFDHDGVALGLGYLTVVVVHTGLYALRTPNIWRIAPVNLASALLVIGAGLIPGGGRYAAWAAALALQALSPLFVHVGGRFDIQPAHFAERHSGLVIVAFGESVVAIGIGEAGRAVTFGLVAAAICGLALSAALWWAFFGAGDDERAEATMTAAPAHARPGLALNGYFYAYIPMLLGIVVIAAGVKRSIGHPGLAAPAASLALAGGVALFLVGDIAFRRALRAGPVPVRSVAAVAALVTAVIGALLAVVAQLLALVAVLALMLVAERRPASPPPK